MVVYKFDRLLLMRLKEFETLFLNKKVLITLRPHYEIEDTIIGFVLSANSDHEVTGIRLKSREVNLLDIKSIGVKNGKLG